jgi:hypothetical protein
VKRRVIQTFWVVLCRNHQKLKEAKATICINFIHINIQCEFYT